MGGVAGVAIGAIDNLGDAVSEIPLVGPLVGSLVHTVTGLVNGVLDTAVGLVDGLLAVT